jgi:hypothetical protein
VQLRERLRVHDPVGREPVGHVRERQQLLGHLRLVVRRRLQPGRDVRRHDRREHELHVRRRDLQLHGRGERVDHVHQLGELRRHVHVHMRGDVLGQLYVLAEVRHRRGDERLGAGELPVS